LYQITVYGKTPGSLDLVVQLLRERQQLCHLEWFQLLMAEDGETGYTGPITLAPEGLYELWHDAPGTKDGFLLEDLVIMPDLFMLRQHMIQRHGKQLFQLDESVRKSFKRLLHTSEKVLVVYQRGSDTGDRLYEMVWPNHVQHLKPEHGTRAAYRLLGIANLDTGAIQ
jgi:hypothetical protein